MLDGHWTSGTEQREQFLIYNNRLCDFNGILIFAQSMFLEELSTRNLDMDGTFKVARLVSLNYILFMLKLKISKPIPTVYEVLQIKTQEAYTEFLRELLCMLLHV